MLGLNLLVGKRDADLPLACHSALFRNRPPPGRLRDALSRCRRVVRRRGAARLRRQRADDAVEAECGEWAGVEGCGGRWLQAGAGGVRAGLTWLGAGRSTYQYESCHPPQAVLKKRIL